MFAGHGNGDSILKPCFEVSQNENKAKILNNANEIIRTVSPTVWFFGCRSIAYRR